MRNVEQEDRSYAFVCRSCSAEGSRDFAVTIWHDEDGVEHESYARSGVPVPDPTRDPICPSCGSNRVTVLFLCRGTRLLLRSGRRSRSRFRGPFPRA